MVYKLSFEDYYNYPVSFSSSMVFYQNVKKLWKSWDRIKESDSLKN
jgi:hypothetical protein